MKTQSKLITLVLNAIAAGTILTTAHGAAFIKFDGVDGESLDKDHKKWSNLASFSHGIQKSIPEGAKDAQRSRGDTTLGDVVVVRELDKSSPKIAESVCNGKVFPKVEIHLTRATDAGRVTYYAYELTNVIVTSYNIRLAPDANGNEVPTESFSLNYEEIKWTYSEYDERGNKKGNIEYGWKVEEGQKGMVEPEPDPTKELADAAARLEAPQILRH